MTKGLMLAAGMLLVWAWSPAEARAEAQGPQWPRSSAGVPRLRESAAQRNRRLAALREENEARIKGLIGVCERSAGATGACDELVFENAGAIRIRKTALPGTRGARIFRLDSDGRTRPLYSVEQVSKMLEDLEKKLGQLGGSRI